MSIPLTSSIARIYGVNKRVVGAGFLVSNRHILTCAHVVAQALNISDESPNPPTENLQLDFPLVAKGLKVNAKVVCWQPVTPLSSTTPRADDEDIAVLEIESTDDNNPGWKPTRLRVADNVWNHDFRAFGFPDQYDEGTWTDGLLKAPQANNWIQIEGKNHFGYFVAPGYSGTAVWDEQLGGVVGMVVVSDKRPGMKAAFIIPTSTLIKVWPALSDSVDPADTPDPRSGPKALTVIGGGGRTVFWTDFDPEYKAFHEAARNSPAYRPDILLITLSSGIVNAMWDEFPAEVLCEANIDVDVLAIQYSGATLTGKLVKGLAGKLRLLLTSTFASYRHLLFVAKDADVIVKQMLIEDAGDMLGSTTHRVLHELRVTSRTRNIISISINSPNGSGRLVKRIADAFKKHLIDCEIVGLPTPDKLDVTSTIFQEAAGESFQQEAGQNGGKRSRLPKPLVANVAKRLVPFSSACAAALARLTIFRSFAVDPQVRALFGSPGAVQENASTSKLGDSQTELLHQLTDLANSAGSDTLRVVTGEAGTGKSALLRRVARSLAVMWLRGTHAAALPIFVPLNQFKIDGSDPNPGRVWQLLTRELAGWGNELLASNATVEERNRIALISIDEAWINDQLRRFPTTLILDGVDEFLLNNPALSLTDFAALLRFLRTEFNGNLQFLTIVGIRSSARDTSLIANSAAEVLTLRGMTPSEASAIFPSAMRFIGRASDAAVQRLLLTPLVLGVLDKSKLMLKPEAYLNRAALISAALTAEIESLRHSWIGTPYSTSDWINALSLLAWLQFRELQGEISDKYVATSAATAIEAWTADPNNEPAADIIKSFRMLLEPEARTALLRKTIYVPVRENSYRLRHKEWADYLVSHYAVLCIRYGHFDDLAVRALNHDIYIMAGQQFEESDTDRSTVHALVERASSQNRFLIIGNFAQMLGATFAPITGDVLDDEILSNLHLFPIVVKFAMLSALSSRMLAHDEHDNWHQFLSPVVLKTLHQHVLNEDENSLVRSLCWCFLKAMTNTDASWPGLWDKEKQNLDTLSVIATQSENGFEVDARQRSIQVAFIRIQSYALEIPNRIISTVHYLYPLVVAFHRKIPLDRTVIVELPLLLSDPKVDAVYRSHPVPEIAAIWNRCKDLYNEAVARPPQRKHP